MISEEKIHEVGYTGVRCGSSTVKKIKMNVKNTEKLPTILQSYQQHTRLKGLLI